MPLTFRPIRRAEITEASYLIDAAYGPQRRRLYGNTRLGRWHHYEEAKIESYIEREPQGVRVGLWNDNIIAFHVCRSYGPLGWFHTLAVHPRFQSRGVGRQAVADAETYLSGQGVTSLALMTWPTAIDNLAFYLRLGYRMAGLSVYAYREAQTSIITGRSPFYATLLSVTPREELDRIWRAVRMLGYRIMPGLDYVSWLQWSLDNDFADALLLWRDSQLFALALFYAFPNAHWAEGKLLLIHPDLTPLDHLWLLEHIRNWVRDLDRDSFGLPVALESDFPRQSLLPHGFRFYPESMAHLVKGEDLPNSALHFVRFGG
ncbi:MAG TPA: GNAT family N-acetyltransferase [Anaerolineae bacterium]|nr:GNAT family N-acetyltransferase [Anaerolineae bacterium]HIQ11535.1 GNAT family N-acetyltransferase [Caldilineales bacterium]